MRKPPKPCRGRGEGNVRLRKDRRWESSITIGKTAKGHPKRRFVYGKSRAEVIEKAAKLKSDFHRGLLIDVDKTTFKEYANKWLERKTRGKAANTRHNYENELEYAFGKIGDLNLQRIKPTNLKLMLEALIEEGYSTRTVNKVLQRVRSVFKDAVGHELIYRNPAEGVTADLLASEPVGKTLEPEDVSRLLDTSERHHAGLLFRLILTTGLRKSEALALTWADIDFQTAQLKINKGWVRVKGQLLTTSPKTKNSRRTVPLPPNLLARLEEHRKKIIAELSKKDSNKQIMNTHIFGMIGETTPFVPDMPNKWLNALLQSAGIAGHYRVHDLRHTYGSLQLRTGVPLEVVSERMGHANPTITLSIYRHVLEDERQGHIYDIEDVIKKSKK